MVDHAAVGRKSARIGKDAERGVLRAVRANGFPMAELKRVEHKDRLDLNLCAGVIGSVKAGEYARTASLGTLAMWHSEAEEKLARCGGAFALLIVQRRGYGMDPDKVLHWRCWIIGQPDPDRDHWEAQLHRALKWLRGGGYGDPLEGYGEALEVTA